MSKITFWVVFLRRKYEVSYDSSMKIKDFILDITYKFIHKSTVDKSECIVKLGDELINVENYLNKKIGDIIEEEDLIDLIIPEDINAGGGYWYDKTINIKFLKLSNNYINNNDSSEIVGLLKLCLLKEVSQKIPNATLRQLPELVYRIMEILSKGYIEDYNIKESIKKTLLSSKGSSIINFSNFVDEIIDNCQMNKILNLLTNSDLKQMNDIRNHL